MTKRAPKRGPRPRPLRMRPACQEMDCFALASSGCEYCSASICGGCLPQHLYECRQRAEEWDADECDLIDQDDIAGEDLVPRAGAITTTGTDAGDAGQENDHGQTTT